jgi:hypothetical protein
MPDNVSLVDLIIVRFFDDTQRRRHTHKCTQHFVLTYRHEKSYKKCQKYHMILAFP